ncbi:polyprotein, partial [Phytophthora megakarya]
TYGLVYRRVGDVLPLRVDAYCDADHANCVDTSRSITSYLLRLNECTFLYKSKRQGKVTTDTCSSELIAASMCVEDLIWARKLMKEITGNAMPCSTLHIDNQSTITVVSEPGNYQRMKRFAKRTRKIAEFVKQHKIAVQYVSSEQNIADIFTKALGPHQFQSLRQALNVEDVAEAIQGH